MRLSADSSKSRAVLRRWDGVSDGEAAAIGEARRAGVRFGVDFAGVRFGVDFADRFDAGVDGIWDGFFFVDGLEAGVERGGNPGVGMGVAGCVCLSAGRLVRMKRRFATGSGTL